MINRTRMLAIGAAAILGLMSSMVGLAADPAPAAKSEPLSNRWRIELDGKSKVDGEIVLAIVLDGVTTNVTTKVPKGKGENAVAKLIRDQLKLQAPAKHFHVETDDGEDVLIKKKLGMGTDNFGLHLASSSVTGLQVEIEKE